MEVVKVKRGDGREEKEEEERIGEEMELDHPRNFQNAKTGCFHQSCRGYLRSTAYSSTCTTSTCFILI